MNDKPAQITDRDSKLVPEGVYRAKAIRWQYIEGETFNGEATLSVCVEMTTHNGRAISWFGSCALNTNTPSGESAWEKVTKPALRALGWTGDPKVLDLDSRRTVNVEIEHEMYDSRMRARVRSIWQSPIDTKAARPETIEQFAAMAEGR